jgi:hypothetical protein
LNLGEETAISDSQSFIVDLVRPETTINDFVVTQNPFSPNKDGYQDTTSFLFNLSEDVYATIKVYTYDEDKNYNAGNLVKTICEDLLITDREQNVIWDGTVNAIGGQGDPNSNGYVDKGCYAYIVEASDRAGNIAIKRGGTVWVQDMPLELLSGDVLPAIFSSSGNSSNKEVKADYWLTAEYAGEVKPPEKIQVAAAGHSRPIGIINVVVRDASNQLIKVLTSESGAETQKITVKWDGKDSYGMAAGEGIYYIVAYAEDFTGVPAGLDSATERKMVIVDNTEPELNIASISNRFFSPNSTQATSIKDTSFSYGLADNLTLINPEAENKVTVTLEIYKETALVNELMANATKEATDSLVLQDPVTWMGDLPGGLNYVGTENGGGEIYPDGEYILKITAVDVAGNSTIKTDTFVVDTIKPTGALEIRRQDGVISEFTNSIDNLLALTQTDANPDKMRSSNDGSNFSQWEGFDAEKNWSLISGDGSKEVWVNYLDKAGNLSVVEIKDAITLDTQIPRIVSAPEPAPITSVRSSININLTLTDLNSGVDTGIESWELIINNSSGNQVDSFSGSGTVVAANWNAGGVMNGSWDGKYYYYVVATDRAGNTLRSYEHSYGSYKPYGNQNSYYRAIVDRTLPTASISWPNAGSWCRRTVNINGTATDANPGSYTIYYSRSGVNSWSVISNAVCPVNGKLAEWNTSGLNDGNYDLRMIVEDTVGNRRTVNVQGVKVDNTPPVVNVQLIGPNPFNPYLDNLVSVNIKVDGESCGEFRQFASVYTSDEQVKIAELNNVDGADYNDVLVPNIDGNLAVKWSGKNGNGDGDFVNEGDYKLFITIGDKAGNQTMVKPIVRLEDDQRITNNSINSTNPYLKTSGNTLVLNWIEGWNDNFEMAEARAHADPWGDDDSGEISFFVNFGQTARVFTWAHYGIISDHWVYDSTGEIYHSNKREDAGNGKNISLSEGPCKAKARAKAYSLGPGGNSKTRVEYYYRWYNQKARTSLNWGRNWGNITGPESTDGYVNIEAYVESKAPKNGVGPDNYSISENFIIGRRRMVSVYLLPFGFVDDGKRSYSIVNADTNVAVWSKGDEIPYGTETLFKVWLDPGVYYLKVRACAVYTGILTFVFDTASARMRVQYRKLGITTLGNHSVWSSGNQIWYRWGHSHTPAIKLTNSTGVARNPSLAVDSNGNAYLTWEDNRDGNWEIYFQKIPTNFAPVNGSPTASSVILGGEQTGTTQASTLEVELLSPIDGDTIDSRRPTFAWKGTKGVFENYKVLWSRDDKFPVHDRGESPLRTDNVHGREKEEDLGYIYFGYTVPNIEPALEPDVTYYWTVIAATGETQVSPEAETFRCEPDFELTGVTNYPNPFNPKREDTNIRYKLSRDADDVKIRIYDITGSLVIEIPNCARDGF